jgi:3-hydroxyisobutyrate dehydrogenase
MAKVAFLGLGVMGYPMARHLGQKGHEVTVYNRTFAKAEKWVSENGGRAAKTPAEAAEGQEIVFACVGNDDDLRSVTTAEGGAFGAIAKGAAFVDHTTASASIARELEAAARERGFGFVDAPVSGGQAGAENGVLTVMCGGAAETYGRVEPVIMSYARSCRLSGGGLRPARQNDEPDLHRRARPGARGSGPFRQACRARHRGRARRDLEGRAGSWQMENRGKTMNEGKYEFGFAVDWMRKDLSICLDEARRNGATLPVTATVDQFYGEVQRMGGNRWDTSSLLARLQQNAKKT